MDWLKGILSNLFSGPKDYNGGTPLREDVLMFNDLNNQRMKSGLPNVTPDYYASTYLPGAYKDTMGYQPGTMDRSKQRLIMNNPFLNNLYNEIAPEDIPTPQIKLY